VAMAALLNAASQANGSRAAGLELTP
jgi:hypothetical protein